MFSRLAGDPNEQSEEIVPEKAFAPYVENGTILKFHKKIYVSKLKEEIEYFCYTLPNDAWRADAFFWINHCYADRGMRFDPAFETMIGRPLGYSEEDIRHYIENFMTHHQKKSA